MKFVALIIVSLVFGLNLSARAGGVDKTAAILYKISVDHEGDLINNVFAGRKSAVRADVVNFNINDCAGEIQTDGKLVGHCWVHVTSYREITVAELNRLVASPNYGETEVVISSSNPVGPGPAKIERKYRDFLSMEITAKADGSNAKVVIMTLE